LNYRKKLNKLIPGGSHTYSRGFDQFPSNAPQILVHGKGPYVWDNKKIKYLDYGMGLRSVTIGYANKTINKEVIKNLNKGNSLFSQFPFLNFINCNFHEFFLLFYNIHNKICFFILFQTIFKIKFLKPL
jgi:4-aminobutyrate aminotransferase-like enzyme